MTINYDPVRIRVMPRCPVCNKPSEFSVYVLENKEMRREVFTCPAHLPESILNAARDDWSQ